jgi:WD40 repeat protein
LGTALKTLKGHSDWVYSVAFSPNSKLLASTSGEATVKLWDARSGAALQTFKVDAVVQTLSFSDDKTYIQTDKGPLYNYPISF